MTDLAGLLACPRCDAALETLHCTSCQVDYPVHDGLPWLFADPQAAVSDWRNRWQLARERMRADLDQVRAALQDDPSPATRRRLETLAAGYEKQNRHLDTLLEPLARAAGGSLETLLALRTRLPPTQDIFSYEANVHRDWCWGDEECRAALGAVMAALDGHAPQRILVLGAGAGRLAYDLHQNTAAAFTAALDLNPLLAAVGRRVSAGESVNLMEFPLAPREPESAAIERRLSAPAPARAGLEFLLADAMRPPFQAGTFDVVVTPWLLDVIEVPAATALRHINRLLCRDGVWLNHGSVAFDAPDPAARLTLEELQEQAVLAGFADLSSTQARMPYMMCPDSRHGRMESVVTLRGRKAQDVPAPARQQNLPEWIVQGRTPVPALPAFKTQAMTTRMHAYIMSLIDGRRTLKDMARILEEQGLMPRREAETALRGFLVKMHEEALAGGRPV